MDIVLFIAGLLLTILGAHFLVKGSVSIAQKLHMSEFLIGLTIVGIGTSLPELVVSLIGATTGSGDIAIGNATGSNIANILLILGLSILIQPIPVNRQALKFDLPYNVLSTILLLIFSFGLTFWKTPAYGTIDRIEGVVFLLLFIFFMYYSFHSPGQDIAEPEVTDQKNKKAISAWLSVIMIVGGLTGLLYGGRLFVDGGIHIARSLGVSEAVISITFLALGTSLPELATSVIASIEGKTQLALGNIIGSNIFNVYLILGVAATVSPLETGSIIPLDIYITILAALMLYISALVSRKRTIGRFNGALFLAVYTGYIYLLITR